MHFQGKQLISRRTELSSRSLTSLAFAKIFVVAFGINVTELQILGVQPGTDVLDGIANFLIGFLAIAHVLTWLGDLHSFQNWNVSTRVSGLGLIGAVGEDLLTKLEGSLARIRSFDNLIEKTLQNHESKQKETLKNIGIQIERISSDLINLKKSVEQLNTHAKLYLYGWYLAVPLASAFTAVFLPFVIPVG